VLSAGDPVPEVTVWTAPRQAISLREFLQDEPAVVVFYLFDWSAT
jgi:peroxiredoxin